MVASQRDVSEFTSCGACLLKLAASGCVQVTRATEEQHQDQQRMLLSINHKGIIVAVNPGAHAHAFAGDRPAPVQQPVCCVVRGMVCTRPHMAGIARRQATVCAGGLMLAGVPRNLFGFDGLQLVGKSLASIIDIFSEWKQGHGEELSLLELLVGQMLAASADGTAGDTRSRSACASWRVAVHRPVPEGTRQGDEVSCFCDVVAGVLSNGVSILLAGPPAAESRRAAELLVGYKRCTAPELCYCHHTLLPPYLFTGRRSWSSREQPASDTATKQGAASMHAAAADHAGGRWRTG